MPYGQTYTNRKQNLVFLWKIEPQQSDAAALITQTVLSAVGIVAAAAVTTSAFE